MAKKVKINQDLCIACSTCWVLNSANFGQGTDGKAKVKCCAASNELLTEVVVKEDGGVGDAVASCPVGAITEEEEEIK